MSSDPFHERVNVVSLAITVAFAALAAGVVAFGEEPVTPAFVAFAVVGTAFLAVSAVDAVRSHDLYDLGRAIGLSVLLGLWWVTLEHPDALVSAFVVVAVLWVGVELYNYVFDTSYLHV